MRTENAVLRRPSEPSAKSEEQTTRPQSIENNELQCIRILSTTSAGNVRRLTKMYEQVARSVKTEEHQPTSESIQKREICPESPVKIKLPGRAPSATSRWVNSTIKASRYDDYDELQCIRTLSTTSAGNVRRLTKMYEQVARPSSVAAELSSHRFSETWLAISRAEKEQARKIAESKVASEMPTAPYDDSETPKSPIVKRDKNNTTVTSDERPTSAVSASSFSSWTSSSTVKNDDQVHATRGRSKDRAPGHRRRRKPTMSPRVPGSVSPPPYDTKTRPSRRREEYQDLDSSDSDDINPSTPTR